MKKKTVCKVSKVVGEMVAVIKFQFVIRKALIVINKIAQWYMTNICKMRMY